jgi:hypothetical protein
MGDHGDMPETRHQAERQDSRALLDRRLAYLLLRLTLGLNILLHGAMRLPALGAFVASELASAINGAALRVEGGVLRGIFEADQPSSSTSANDAR